MHKTLFFTEHGNMDFFERVKALAKQNKTTIESVVKEAGLTIDSYNSYRRHGNLPRADEAVKIAKALNTTVEFLVTGENSTPKPDTTKIIQTIESALEQAKNL